MKSSRWMMFTLALLGGSALAQGSGQEVMLTVEGVPPLPTARMNHWQLRLIDGRVAAIGGHGPGFISLSTADIYDPTANEWSTIQMNHIHDAPALARLLDGRYLIAGGAYDLGVPANPDAELYSPLAGTFTDTQPLIHARANSAAATLMGTQGRFFTNWNLSAVDNNPTAPTTFELMSPAVLTYINTYHWNFGSGTGDNGTIAIRHSDGTLYGPWSVRTLPGQGGVPNALWIAEPNIPIPAGVYTVVDSEPATWSHNGASGNAGFSEVWTSSSGSIGHVLVVGAWYNSEAAAQPEIYNPSTGEWSLTAGQLNAPRSSPLVVALNDGSALVLGGMSSFGLPFVDPIERYDPVARTFSVVRPELFPDELGWQVTQDFNRRDPDEGRLPDGRLVYFAMRSNPDAQQLFTVDPETGAVEKYGPPVQQPDPPVAIGHAAPIIDLANDMLIIMGYEPAEPRATMFAAGAALNGAPPVVYIPHNTVQVAGWPIYAGRTLLPDGSVLQAGGHLSNNFDAIADSYRFRYTLVEVMHPPDLIPVLHIAIGGNAGQAPQYRYTWTSSGDDTPVVHGPTDATSDMLMGMEGGPTLDQGETWTVEVTPISSTGSEGPVARARFIIGTAGTVTFDGWIMQ